MDINPAVIVQSSLALVVAMTSMEVVRSGLELVESDIPHETFKYRLITLAFVIFLTILIIKCLAKEVSKDSNSVSNDILEIPNLTYAATKSAFSPMPSQRRY